MKKLLLKSLLLLCALIVGTNAWGQAAVNTVLWSEDFSGFGNNVDPSGDYTNSHTGTAVYGSVTVTYSKDDGGGTTQTYTSGGPNSNNNLLIAKNNGTFSISGISTGQATELTVSYAKSGDGVIAISSSTTGVTISGSTSGSTITTNGATTLQLTFKNTGSKNLRIDDISVKVKTAGTGGGGVAAPTFSVPEGAVTAGTTVELEQADNKTIRYTTDGSNPSKTTGTVYSSAITITSPVTIKAIAVDGDNVSIISSATYTINVAKPTFDVAAGAVEKGTSLTITATAGYSIIYTTDGTDPSYASSNGDVYDSPITINSAMTVKAIAVDAYDNESDITSAAYTIKKVVTPTFSVAEGAVLTGTMLALSTTTPDAVIHYTTDGTEPTASSPTYSSKIVIDANMTVKAIAVKTNWDDSDVASAAYTVVDPVPGLSIDFEVSNLKQYTDWDFENVGNINTAITAHGGTKYGANINGSGNGVNTCSITTKNKIAYPASITFYVSKSSNNTSGSNWYVEVSENGSAWTQVGTAQDAKSMNKGTWVEVSRDLTSYSNVYVRIRYGSSNAIRAVDDITLTIGPAAGVDDGAGHLTITTTDNMNGWRTFYDASQDYEVDGNTKIYVAKESATAGEVELTALAATKIPAGEAVILKTTDANHEMVLTETTGAETLGANVLAVTDGSSNVDGYRLGYKSGTGIAFYKYTATAPAAGIVYIDKDDVNTGSSARDYLTFSFDEESETTGLNEVKTQKIAGEYFNLAGQRVANPTKGLYIVNGKKVVIK